MDWTSLAGVGLAIASIIVGRLLEGGHILSLVQPAAFVIVVVGTMGAVLLQSGMPAFIRGVKMARWVFSPPADNVNGMILQLTGWSALARREGLLSLEQYVHTVRDPFVAKALRLAVDGIDTEKIRTILDIEISSYERRERQALKIWEAAGGYAPTIGILGAVLGLIHVMENLAEPSRLGNGIAVAFVATVYGVGLANLVFLPIANKLKMIVTNEVARREMLADVLLSIANGDNPRVVQERLAAYA
ncbi:flagellar motor protein [Herbaspirillum sp. GCM10030257]|uniref:flagellar motor protein n=1 Tax=Herbaspirillum sp. GCM10030257 TaxID=3273393 RepID=UPI00361D7E7C